MCDNSVNKEENDKDDLEGDEFNNDGVQETEEHLTV